MAKMNFHSSVAHGPSEIILIWWFDAQKPFLIIINVEKTVAYNFMETMIHFYFRIFDE